MGAILLLILERLSLRKRRADLPALRELLGSEMPARIVDVGGGTGLTTDAFAPTDGTTIVLEPEADKVAFGKARRPRLKFVRGRAEDLPFPDASLDRVVGIVSFHHVERPDRALDEIHRAMKPGGRLVFLELHPDHPGLLPRLFGRHAHGTDPHFYPPDRLRDLVAAHGFRGVSVREGVKAYFVAATR